MVDWFRILEVNGNYLKLVFGATTLFFFGVIGFQIWRGSDAYVTEVLMAMVVFYALVGRKVVDAYTEATRERVRRGKV